MGDASIGGTIWQGADVVYLNGEMERDSWLKQTLFHEIGHLVADQRDAKFSSKKWSALNGAGFHYGKGRLYAIKSEVQESEPRDFYFAQGFASNYAQSSVDEDFACLSEYMMSGDKDFWKAVDEYPLLAKKVAYAVKIYGNLDKGFTETYFRNLPDDTMLPSPVIDKQTIQNAAYYKQESSVQFRMFIFGLSIMVGLCIVVGIAIRQTLLNDRR